MELSTKKLAQCRGSDPLSGAKFHVNPSNESPSSGKKPQNRHMNIFNTLSVASKNSIVNYQTIITMLDGIVYICDWQME